MSTEKPKLEACERETVITYDDSGSDAIIFTASRGIITKCRKANYKEVCKDGFGGFTFKTNKKNIMLGKTRKKRVKNANELDDDK